MQKSGHLSGFSVAEKVLLKTSENLNASESLCEKWYVTQPDNHVPFCVFIPYNTQFQEVKMTRILTTLLIPIILFITGCEEATEPDNTPPVVTLTSPVNGTVLSQSITITPVISDESSIKTAYFLVDGDTVITDFNAPFTFLWNVGFWADGNQHSILIIAVDAANNSGQSALINVTVSADATLSIQPKSPSDGQELEENAAVTFFWYPLAGSLRYELEIDSDSLFNPSDQTLQTTDTLYLVQPLQEGTQYWRIRAVGKNGRFSTWSEKRLLFIGKAYWVLTLDRGRAEWINGLVETQDGGAIFLGPSFTDTTDIMEDWWYGKVSAAGKVIWKKTLSQPKSDYGNAILRTSNNHFLLFGGSADPNRTMRLLKIDGSGGLIWDHSYGKCDSSSWGVNLVGIQTESTFYLGGELNNKPSIIMLDGTGSVLWTKQLPYSNSGSCYLSLRSDNTLIGSAGNHLVFVSTSGSLFSQVDFPDSLLLRRPAILSGENGLVIPYLSNGKGGMIKTTATGSKDWSYKYPSGTDLNAFMDWFGEGIMVGGSRNGNTYLAVFSYSGSLLWQKELVPGRLGRIVRTMNGGLYLSGNTHPDFRHPSSDFLIMKTDKNGNGLQMPSGRQTILSRLFNRKTGGANGDPMNPSGR